ncbi:uncharacterized protein [Antedon mediterranea]|uniref:uncharacterized protein n=1 Tax=Antedon mediterranea TaxID=105859 RepID=UPI003AF78527
MEAAKAMLDIDEVEKEEEMAAAQARANVLQAELQHISFEDIEEELSQLESNNQMEEVQGAPQDAVPSQRMAEVLNELPKMEPSQRVENYLNNAVEVPMSTLNPGARSYEPNHMQEYIRILARQRLPLQEPDIYSGDPIMFLPWKRSFEAMVKTACVDTVEKLSFLCKYTTGEAKVLVDRFRLRHVEDVDKAYHEAWTELEDRFGNQTLISAEIILRLTKYRRFKAGDLTALQELADLCGDAVAQMQELPHLITLNTPHGIKPIVEKLPHFIINKWREKVAKHKRKMKTFPNFSIFTEFLSEMAHIQRDPDVPRGTVDEVKTDTPGNYRTQTGYRPKTTQRSTVNVRMTEVNKSEGMCPLHNGQHPLVDCRNFLAKTYAAKKSFLKENQVCFRCLSSTSHMARNCDRNVRCGECGSDRHPTVFHGDRLQKANGGEQVKAEQKANGGEQVKMEQKAKGEKANGGEQGTESQKTKERDKVVSTTCTDVCGGIGLSRSCAKICLAKIHLEDHPNTFIKTYIILDDQSNRSLAKSEVFDLFNINARLTSYTLKTCSGAAEVQGRKLEKLIIESMDGKTRIAAPSLLECNDIPGNKAEIPTPETASNFPHLKDIADKIPPLDENANITILLGRDAAQAHKVREVRNGPNHSPWGQRLDLGWMVIGDVCLGGAHQKNVVTANRNHIKVLRNGRPSAMFTTCKGMISAKEITLQRSCDVLGGNVFQQKEDDEQYGMSREDVEFVQLMGKEMKRGEQGNWIAPLPFREERKRLPNNKQQAMNRMQSLIRTLDKKPEMKAHYLAFLEKVFSKQHAELVEDDSHDEECWYLPHFGVYHPQKPGKIRVVFDSSAQFQDTSLNNVLMSGPDLVNGLLGVLIRFRQDPVAFVADIEQMFYSFQVVEEHRDFLRFLWFEDNDPSKVLRTYRMKVHIFGNKPSPAVATLGLRKTAQEGESEFGADAREFVEKNFYVDDGLKSLATSDEAIDLLKRTQAMLATANLRLHKIVSNDAKVIAAFSPQDVASNMCNLDLGSDAPLTQRSLGVLWDVK